jgi:hypothetical protein
MSALLYILLGWSLTVLGAWGWGVVPMRLLRLEAGGNVGALYRFLLGAGWLSLLIWALCMARLVYKGAIYAVLGVGLVLLWRYRPQLERVAWRRSGWVFVVFGVYYFVYALMPELSPDGMSYHLGLVNRYYREHGFAAMGTNLYASLSQGLEMLFLAAFGIGRHSAAALVHFTFLLLLPCLLGLHAGEMGWRAGLFVFVLPLMGLDGVSAYNDVALTVVGVAMVDAMWRWQQSRALAWVGVAAYLVGFAFGIKYTGVFLALLLLPAWRAWPRWAWAGLLSLPWLLKNYWYVGNPVAPFFNAWFPNEFFTAEFEAGYREFLGTYGVASVGEWAREAILGGTRLSGFLGPAALLLPLGALAWRDARWRWWMAGALATLAVYPQNIGTRFLLPATPFLALGLFSLLAVRNVYVLALGVVCAWPTIRGRYSHPHTWRFDRIEWKAALRVESEENFLIRKRAGYVSARTIETFVPAGERVYAAVAVAESYTNREIIVGYQSKFGTRLQQALAAHAYDGYQPTAVYRCSANTIRVKRDSPDTWSVNEIEPRPRAVRCSRMPWDAALAMDGNFVSRYRTWGPARAGDSCVLEGEGPWKLFGSTDQWGVELEGCTRSVEKVELDYRQEARRFFLSQGVRYLAIDAPDFGSADMKARPDAWGLELIAERGTMRLYRWREGD